MKIWFQKHTIEGRLSWLGGCRRHFSQAARPGTQVQIRTLFAEAYAAEVPEGLIRYGAVEALFASYFAFCAAHGDSSGADTPIKKRSQADDFANAVANNRSGQARTARGQAGRRKRPSEQHRVLCLSSSVLTAARCSCCRSLAWSPAAFVLSARWRPRPTRSRSSRTWTSVRGKVPALRRWPWEPIEIWPHDGQ